MRSRAAPRGAQLPSAARNGSGAGVVSSALSESTARAPRAAAEAAQALTRQWQGVNAAQPVVVVPTPDRPTKCDASLKATPQTKRKKREHVQHVEHDAPGTPAKKMKTKQHRTQVPDAAAKPQARGESPELGGWGVRAPPRACQVRCRGGVIQGAGQ